MEFEFEKMYYGAVKRGDIVLADLATGPSVLVVLQDNVLNERLSTVLAAPLIPLKKNERAHKNEVYFSTRETGFNKPGACLVHELQPVLRTKINAVKGEISASKLKQIFAALNLNLGRFRDLD